MSNFMDLCLCTRWQEPSLLQAYRSWGECKQMWAEKKTTTTTRGWGRGESEGTPYLFIKRPSLESMLCICLLCILAQILEVSCRKNTSGWHAHLGHRKQPQTNRKRHVMSFPVHWTAQHYSKWRICSGVYVLCRRKRFLYCLRQLCW